MQCCTPGYVESIRGGTRGASHITSCSTLQLRSLSCRLQENVRFKTLKGQIHGDKLWTTEITTNCQRRRCAPHELQLSSPHDSRLFPFGSCKQNSSTTLEGGERRRKAVKGSVVSDRKS